MAGMLSGAPGASTLFEEIGDYLRLQPGEPDGDGPAAGGSRGSSVLLPYSGSPAARGAVDAAIDLAGATGRGVMVLHLRAYDFVRGSRFYSESMAEACATADDGVERLRRGGIRAQATVRGAPRSELAGAIVGEASATEASMIVIGSRHRRRPIGVLQRSLSRAVLQRARCPVLVVPAGWDVRSSGGSAAPPAPPTDAPRSCRQSQPAPTDVPGHRPRPCQPPGT